MLVSIIIPTKNEERNIEKCLESAARQSYPAEKIEIIVVDNNSADRTKEIARKYTDKIFNAGSERSAQKNFGARQAAGEWLLFLDADMRLAENVVAECVKKISDDKGIAALYIPEKIFGRGFWGKARDLERSFYNETAIDAVRFIRRERFVEAGGFDEKLYAAEDWDLDKKLKRLGKFDIIKNSLFHDESDFTVAKYLAKKKYYVKNFNAYIGKWGKNDSDIKKQFGFGYRYFGVFTENGKWKKLIRHPILAAGMYFLRFLVGVKYLMR
jgi:glycosyltransferase involved in cell wall biosynthesis